MTVNSHQLKRMPVVTKLGRTVGHVASFDLDIHTGRIEVFHVALSRLAPVLPGEALVAWSQVVSMDEKQIVVEDGILEESHATAATPAPMPSPPANLKENPLP